MKNLKNKIKIFFLTMSNENKKKIKYGTLFIFIVFLLGLIGFLFYSKLSNTGKIETIQSNLTGTTSINNLQNPINITETVVTDNGLLSKIEEIKNNNEKVDDKFKIIIEKEDDPSKIIDFLYQKLKINKAEVLLLKDYFKNKGYNLDFNCSNQSCNLSEKINLLEQLEKIRDKISSDKNKTSEQIKTFGNQNIVEFYNTAKQNYVCSDKDVYLNRLSKLKDENKGYEITTTNSEISELKNLLENSTNLENIKSGLNSILSVENYSLDFSEIKNLRNSMPVTYTVNFLGNSVEKVFYEYKGILYEKEIVESYANPLKISYYRLTGDSDIRIIFSYGFVDTNKGKIKISKPVAIVPNIGLKNGLVNLFLNSSKDSCNFSTLKFSETDKVDDIIVNLSKKYDEIQKKVVSGQANTDDSYFIKYVNELLKSFIID